DQVGALGEGAEGLVAGDDPAPLAVGQAARVFAIEHGQLAHEGLRRRRRWSAAPIRRAINSYRSGSSQTCGSPFGNRSNPGVSNSSSTCLPCPAADSTCFWKPCLSSSTRSAD